jgi:hypothetical protein
MMVLSGKRGGGTSGSNGLITPSAGFMVDVTEIPWSSIGIDGYNVAVQGGPGVGAHNPLPFDLTTNSGVALTGTPSSYSNFSILTPHGEWGDAGEHVRVDVDPDTGNVVITSVTGMNPGPFYMKFMEGNATRYVWFEGATG